MNSSRDTVAAVARLSIVLAAISVALMRGTKTLVGTWRLQAQGDGTVQTCFRRDRALDA